MRFLVSWFGSYYIFAGNSTIKHNLITTSSSFPHYWMGRITPAYNNRDHCVIPNHQLYYINFAKIFEHLLYRRLFDSIKSHLSNNQHGFVTWRSIISNIVEVTQYISDCLCRRRQVDKIYTDFSKASKALSHRLLIHKLCEHECLPVS